ncbi:MFS transporter, partial [Pseudomonas hunanensis]|uniref:MFS transporter n=1 Tax=Pseudomonas hunanensis TaxID=1247546 RepID=UPI0030D7B9FA
ARLVTGPLLAIWADSLTLRRSAIAILAAVAAVAYLVMALTASYAIWLPVWFIASTAVNAITPLADVLTLKRARREGFQFGVPRGMGSLAFVLANTAMGLLMARTSIDAVIVWTVAFAALTAVTARCFAPPEPVREAGQTLDQTPSQTPSGRDRFKGLG